MYVAIPSTFQGVSRKKKSDLFPGFPDPVAIPSTFQGVSSIKIFGDKNIDNIRRNPFHFSGRFKKEYNKPVRLVPRVSQSLPLFRAFQGCRY